ncbi:hypothetical protein J4207_04675 [Candidatus Woesearchaeota archaeon]|nr:hypothetical protein [Candidatus Woesearchaeota archaeon]
MGLFHKTLNDALACLEGRKMDVIRALGIISAHVHEEHSITSDYADAQRAMGSYQEELIRAAAALEGLEKHRREDLLRESIDAIRDAQTKLGVLNRAFKDLEKKTAKG